MTRLGLLPRRDAEASERAVKAAKPRWISALIVALVLVVGVVALIYVLFRPAADNSTPALTYAPAGGAGVGASAGPCQFPVPQSTSISQVVPVDTVWELVPGSTMAAPRSATAGPLNIVGGVTSCYARTPSGVLLATANLITEMSNSRNDLNQLVSDKTVHSAGYEQLNQRMQAWLAQDRTHEATRQIAGYRLTTFSPDVATLEIVQRNTSEPGVGLMATISYVMRWENDDWKLVPMVDGANLPSMSINSVEQPYLPWAGA